MDGNASAVLRVHQMLSRITVLGPFERFALWTQGCMRRCPGCISPQAQAMQGGTEHTISDILRLIQKHPEQEGMTISGGEPFVQAPALCALIDAVRRERDFGVILYTGYTLEQLQDSDAPEGARALLSRLDLLIDGPYICALNDDGGLRGSSNQRALPLTQRYRAFLSLYGASDGRETQVRWTPDGFFVAGIPCRLVSQIQKMGTGDE